LNNQTSFFFSPRAAASTMFLLARLRHAIAAFSGDRYMNQNFEPPVRVTNTATSAASGSCVLYYLERFLRYLRNNES
jgi:hypothetical protein